MNEEKMPEAMTGEQGNEKNTALEKVLLDQARTIIGGIDVDAEVLAKLMVEKRSDGSLVQSEYKEAIGKMSYEDFLEIAKKAVENSKNESSEELSKEGPVMTSRDVPKSPTNDPEGKRFSQMNKYAEEEAEEK